MGNFKNVFDAYTMYCTAEDKMNCISVRREQRLLPLPIHHEHHD
jgi:hypothetical protein